MAPHLCDSNIWLALSVERHIHNEAALRWFDQVDPADGAIFCRATQQSFLRLLTSAAVFAPFADPPLSGEAAWSAYEALIVDERITFRVDEPRGIERRWKEFSRRPIASPKLWMDAYLAAFAISGGYRMVTTDAGYRQFTGLDLLVLGR